MAIDPKRRPKQITPAPGKYPDAKATIDAKFPGCSEDRIDTRYDGKTFRGVPISARFSVLRKSGKVEAFVIVVKGVRETLFWSTSDENDRTLWSWEPCNSERLGAKAEQCHVLGDLCYRGLQLGEDTITSFVAAFDRAFGDYKIRRALAPPEVGGKV